MQEKRSSRRCLAGLPEKYIFFVFVGNVCLTRGYYLRSQTAKNSMGFGFQFNSSFVEEITFRSNGDRLWTYVKSKAICLKR